MEILALFDVGKRIALMCGFSDNERAGIRLASTFFGTALRIGESPGGNFAGEAAASDGMRVSPQPYS